MKNSILLLMVILYLPTYSLSQTDTVNLKFFINSPFGGDEYIEAVKNNSYIKSIDENGKLRAEGKLYSDCGFVGEAKYYYSDGKIERIEHYIVINPNKCPVKSGIWVVFQIAPLPKKTKNSIENQPLIGWFFFFQSEPNVSLAR